jgi:hypothetical protein
VESPFSAVRLRTDESRRYKRAEDATAVMGKGPRIAEQAWRKLNAPELLPCAASGVAFRCGACNESEPNRGQPSLRSEAIAA